MKNVFLSLTIVAYISLPILLFFLVKTLTEQENKGRKTLLVGLAITVVVAVAFFGSGESQRKAEIRANGESAVVTSIDRVECRKSTCNALFLFTTKSGRLVSMYQSVPRQIVIDSGARKPIVAFYKPSDPTEFIIETQGK